MFVTDGALLEFFRALEAAPKVPAWNERAIDRPFHAHLWFKTSRTAESSRRPREKRENKNDGETGQRK